MFSTMVVMVRRLSVFHSPAMVIVKEEKKRKEKKKEKYSFYKKVFSILFCFHLSKRE